MTNKSDDGLVPAPGAKPPRLGQVIWSRRWQVLRAWLWFVGSLAVLIQVLVWARPFTDTQLTKWIATVTAATLRLAGFEGTAHGTLISSSFGTVEIVRECTGVYPTAMFIAAVLAYPTTWTRKILGIVGGALSIQAINIVRVISLAYILKRFPDVFETAHLVVWQSLIVFFTVLLWVIWAVEFGGKGERSAA